MQNMMLMAASHSVQWNLFYETRSTNPHTFGSGCSFKLSSKCEKSVKLISTRFQFQKTLDRGLKKEKKRKKKKEEEQKSVWCLQWWVDWESPAAQSPSFPSSVWVCVHVCVLDVEVGRCFNPSLFLWILPLSRKLFATLNSHTHAHVHTHTHKSRHTHTDFLLTAKLPLSVVRVTHHNRIFQTQFNGCQSLLAFCLKWILQREVYENWATLQTV